MLSNSLSPKLKLIFHAFYNIRFVLILLSLCCLPPSAKAAPGDLDSTFGIGGKAILRLTGGEDTFYAVAIQSDGKIVVAGVSGGSTLVARYNANGTLDNSFAGDGILTLALVGFSVSQDVSIQSDGKIVVTGNVSVSGSGYDFFVLRLNPDGSLDNSFGNGGVVMTLVTTSDDRVKDMVIQPDGKILIVGEADVNTNNSNIAIVRYNPNGSLDTSFDGDGKVITDIGGNVDRGYALELLSDGKILVFGKSDILDLSSNSLALLRYLPDGSLDNSFDGDGISLTDLGNVTFLIGDMELQNDGKIVVTVSIGSSSTFIYLYTILRYLSNGLPDISFGDNGRTSIFGGTTNFAKGLGIQRNGKIVSVGDALTPTASGDILVARLDQNGLLDPRFGNGGLVFTSVGSHSDYSYDVAFQQDGKIVVAGDFALSLLDTDAVLLRYLGDAVTPFDYDGDGLADVSVFRPSVSDWHILRSSNGSPLSTTFGLPGDVITPADFDGDGKTDIAVYRLGTWYRMNSSNNQFVAVQFGLAIDLPRPGDYDGDGKADISVFRDSNGTWYRLNSSNGAFVAAHWGTSGDIPLIADFDGDGKDDVAVYRTSNQTWHALRSSDNSYFTVQFGLVGDTPTPADYDGDGKTDVSVYRSSEGVWYRLNSSNQQLVAVHFGTDQDTPCAADYDGDGRADIAVYRGENGGVWYLNRSMQGFQAVPFGAPADMPTPSVYSYGLVSISRNQY